MIISNNSLMNKHLNNKMNTENIHFTLSSTLLMKAYLIDSLHYLKHLTLSDVDSNLSTKLINNSNYEETMFDSERYIEPFNLTSLSLNNNDDGYNTVSGITTTPMTVPTIPFMSNIPTTNFTLQISQLVDNLNYLLNDAIRLQDTIHVVYKRQQEQSNDCFKQTVNEDTLSMIDLLHSISHRNRASPELRLYWILQIAEKHYEVCFVFLFVLMLLNSEVNLVLFLEIYFKYEYKMVFFKLTVHIFPDCGIVGLRNGQTKQVSGYPLSLIVN